MLIRRMYSGDDGESHIEEIDLDDHPELTASLGAKSIVFKKLAPGYYMDWYTGPCRQFAIAISGVAEIGLGDGSVHRFEPGQVNLVEDLTGRGHTLRVIGDEPRVMVEIPLE